MPVVDDPDQSDGGTAWGFDFRWPARGPRGARAASSLGRGAAAGRGLGGITPRALEQGAWARGGEILSMASNTGLRIAGNSSAIEGDQPPRGTKRNLILVATRPARRRSRLPPSDVRARDE